MTGRVTPARASEGGGAARAAASREASQGKRVLDKKMSGELQTGLATIGVPVYNAARYLRGALDALLAQDYPDFELIISDNCSTDETGEICREYAARDPRVRLYRAERNMGPIWNFLRVYKLARGEFFMWAAYDDLRHPQYLSRCVEALHANPRAIACFSGFKLINEDGDDVTDVFPGRVVQPVGATAAERIRALAQSTYWIDIYALFRTPALEGSSIESPIWGADVVALCELCLKGDVVSVPEPLFSYRVFSAKTVDEMVKHIDPQGGVPASWNHLAVEMINSVWRAPLRFAEQLKLSALVFKEMCLRNAALNVEIRTEGLRYVRRVFSSGHHLCALQMVILLTTFRSLLALRRLWLLRPTLLSGSRVRRAESSLRRPQLGPPDDATPAQGRAQGGANASQEAGPTRFESPR